MYTGDLLDAKVSRLRSDYKSKRYETGRQFFGDTIVTANDKNHIVDDCRGEIAARTKHFRHFVPLVGMVWSVALS